MGRDRSEKCHVGVSLSGPGRLSLLPSNVSYFSHFSFPEL